MKIVEKIWGEEKWIVNRNDYCGKILILKHDFRCSLHMHKLKDETFYVARGKVIMEVGDKKWVMKHGDVQHIEQGVYHRFTGLTDAEIFEFSTHHEDSDSYRKEESGKSNIRKGYDYDGVVSENVIPAEGAPIITSRSFEEADRFDEKKIKGHPVYFNPITWSEKNTEKNAAWKAEMINRLGIEEYYEDDSDYIQILKVKCPNCNIVKVSCFQKE